MAVLLKYYLRYDKEPLQLVLMLAELLLKDPVPEDHFAGWSHPYTCADYLRSISM